MGSRHVVMVHQFIAFKKFGYEVFSTDCVRHKNGVKTDNSEDNIIIGSNSENQQDIPVNIRKQRSTIAASYVKKHDKEKIVAFYCISKSYKQTMTHFNISSKGTLWAILNK